MKIKLPTAQELANYKTWTGFTIRELVNANRLSPHKAAEESILRIQKEAVAEGNLPPMSDLEKVALAYENLECELLDLLLEI